VTDAMGWFRKTPKNAEELAQVKQEMDKLREAMDRHDIQATALANSLNSQPDLPALVGRIDALDTTLGNRNDPALAAQLDQISKRLDDLDARITSVSTELANQISELGGEIDTLQKRAEAEPMADEVADMLRDSQERLASEQARYQIAFREDLAKLAEQLRRPRS
jgi:DNA repair exonuclease SbcCD ATPase subunit